MSMFGGLMGGGGDSPTYTPSPTPGVPQRGDDTRNPRSQARTKWFYTGGAFAANSYKTGVKSGGAANPSKSYAANLFNASGGGGL